MFRMWSAQTATGAVPTPRQLAYDSSLLLIIAQQKEKVAKRRMPLHTQTKKVCDYILQGHNQKL